MSVSQYVRGCCHAATVNANFSSAYFHWSFTHL